MFSAHRICCLIWQNPLDLLLGVLPSYYVPFNSIFVVAIKTVVFAFIPNLLWVQSQLNSVVSIAVPTVYALFDAAASRFNSSAGTLGHGKTPDLYRLLNLA